MALKGIREYRTDLADLQAIDPGVIGDPASHKRQVAYLERQIRKLEREAAAHEENIRQAERASEVRRQHGCFWTRLPNAAELRHYIETGESK